MSIPYLEVLNNRTFRHLWISQIMSQVALNMLNFILAIKVYQLTHSHTAVSTMLLTFSIPAIVMGVIAGGIVDHYDKRAILLWCNISRVVLFLLFFLFPQELFLLYVLSIIMSAVTQLFVPAEGPVIASLVKEKDLLSANSLFTISYFLSTCVGFLLAGPAIYILGYEKSYLGMAVMMSVASYYVSVLPSFPSHSGHMVFSYTDVVLMCRTLKEGISFIFRTVRVRQSLILLTVSQTLVSSLAVLAPGFAETFLYIPVESASLYVIGPAAIGLVLGALAVGPLGERYLKGILIYIGLCATGIVLLFLAVLSEYFILSLGLLSLLGFFNSWITVPASTILQQDSEESVRGRVYGVLSSVSGGVSLLPVIASGVVADAWGVGNAMIMLGSAILCGVCAYRLFVPKKRRMIS